jgi:hypothetical protein
VFVKNIVITKSISKTTHKNLNGSLDEIMVAITQKTPDAMTDSVRILKGSLAASLHLETTRQQNMHTFKKKET